MKDYSSKISEKGNTDILKKYMDRFKILI